MDWGEKVANFLPSLGSPGLPVERGFLIVGKRVERPVHRGKKLPGSLLGDGSGNAERGDGSASFVEVFCVHVL